MPLTDHEREQIRLLSDPEFCLGPLEKEVARVIGKLLAEHDRLQALAALVVAEDGGDGRLMRMLHDYQDIGMKPVIIQHILADIRREIGGTSDGK